MNKDENRIELEELPLYDNVAGIRCDFRVSGSDQRYRVTVSESSLGAFRQTLRKASRPPIPELEDRRTFIEKVCRRALELHLEAKAPEKTVDFERYSARILVEMQDWIHKRSLPSD